LTARSLWEPKMLRVMAPSIRKTSGNAPKTGNAGAKT